MPSLDDANLKSPVGIFLSPHPPTPSLYRSLDPAESFDKADESKGTEKENEETDDKSFVKSPKSPRTRDQERERFVATPTDFAIDYGKHLSSGGSFDNSNGKAWSTLLFILLIPLRL